MDEPMYAEDVNQEVPPQIPYSYIPSQNESLSESSLRYQLDAEEIIEELRHNLLGHRKVYVGNKHKWLPSKSGGDINEKGMGEIESELRLRLTKIFKLTKLEDEAIFGITMTLFTNLWDSMWENQEEWGITKITTITKICNMICDSVFVTLKAAQNGEYLLFLKSTYNIMENRMTRGGNQPLVSGRKRGITDRLAGMFK